MNYFAKAFGQMMYEKIQATTNGKNIFNPAYYAAYYPKEKKIQIEFNFLTSKNTYEVTSVDFNASADMKVGEVRSYWAASKSTYADYYNLDLDNPEYVSRNMDYKINSTKKGFYIYLTLPPTVLDIR